MRSCVAHIGEMGHWMWDLLVLDAIRVPSQMLKATRIDISELWR